MKPLAHWAIHHQQKIRIAGRNQSEIWGQLAGSDGTVRPFRYAQNILQLMIDEGDACRVLHLDAYGFEQPPITPDLLTQTRPTDA
jgi:hypothetical protein